MMCSSALCSWMWSARRSVSRTGALALTMLCTPALAHAQDGTLPGYTADDARRELQAESTTVTLMAPDRARAMVRELSQEPHVAGTPAEAKTRDIVKRYFTELGIGTTVDTYSIYMPHPTSVRLFRVWPDSAELPTVEGPIPDDTTSTSYPQVLTYNGYSASGDVTGEVVFVNYGLIEDYKILDSLGVSVKGKIVIARYGKSYRGIKAREAEKHGALGLIIYSDPAEDGYTRGDIYPEGPMRPWDGVQRGSVYNDNGDPTTPDYPSLPGAKRVPLSQTTIPRIPVMPTSYRNAMALLAYVRGTAPLPTSWQGALPFRYHIGPGPVRARIVIQTDEQTTPYKDIWNVRGVIRGSEFPNEVIVIGGHRDAWGPGAADNVSGTVSVLEVARTISTLAKQGYRPKRTIMFASWDAEEWGLMGSTEYVEQDSAMLFKNGVAYFNQDMVAFGPVLGATGTPSLRPLFRDVTKEITDPQTHASVYDMWRAHSHLAPGDTTQPPIDDPGGGSDFAGFYNHLGIPVVEWGFSGPQGIYHSAYDSFNWVSKFGDPTFQYHSLSAAIGANAILRLANADILPYDYVEYARAMRGLANDASKAILAKGWNDLSMAELMAAIGRMESAAILFQGVRDSVLATSISTETAQQVDARLLTVERAFVRPTGLVNREWFRNVICAADDDNGYDNITLPTITEAIRANDRDRTVREIADLAQRFDSAAAILTQTAQSLR